MKFADQAIAKTKARLTSVLDLWRKQGVVQIKKSFVNSMSDKRLAFYPEYSKFAKSYTIVGLDGKGVQKVSLSWPDRGAYSESRYRLVGLASDQCQISNNKKANFCSVFTPKAKDWLRVSIIERVDFVEANSGGYWFTQPLANTFTAREAYSVKDGFVFSDTITRENLPGGGLPLAAKVDIFDYKIEIAPDKWHATYTMVYMAPQKIAGGLTKSIDGFGEIALTPKFNW